MRRCLTHHARRVATRRAGVARILAEHVEHVAEVEADGAHVQEHLRVAQWREGGQQLEEEAADGATRVEVQTHEAVQG